MGISDVSNYIVTADLSIMEAMKQIDLNTSGLVYVIDNDGKLIGCLTDGDVRRWIIRNGSVEGRVSDAMFHEPRFIHEAYRDQAYSVMKDNKLYSIAVIDEGGHIADVIFDRSILQTMTIRGKGDISGTPVIIMAGGKGTRLYPYTKILPKPLIPIGEVPIIERILDRFHRYGVSEFWLSVNYKKEMIKSYFAELDPDYRINYIEENTPLGTAGSISLINEKFDSPIIVANCDSLIDANYNDVVRFHKSNHNTMTIISSLKNVSIPYGVLRSEKEGLITSMEEKPQLTCFINTGMYVIEPEVVNMIPKNQVFHMTELADHLIKSGRRVGMFPVKEDSFLDMGEFEEMKRMEEHINSIQEW